MSCKVETNVKELGFTLLEILIVIAIIGVLSAIAVPQYQIYVAKTQTGRIIGEVSALRLTAEVCLNEGKFDIGLASNQCDPRAVGSNLIQGGSQVSLQLPNDTGVAQFTNPLTSTTKIIAKVSTNVAPPLRRKKIIWSRSSHGTWSCYANIKEKYLPSNCQFDGNI